MKYFSTVCKIEFATISRCCDKKYHTLVSINNKTEAQNVQDSITIIVDYPHSWILKKKEKKKNTEHL